MEKINKENLPYHVAVIPDGNRRWAKKRGFKPWQGHEEGAKVIEVLTQKALDMGIKCITFWGSSMDNLTKRPLSEKRVLLKIYEKYFKRLMEDPRIYKNQTKINIIGRWEKQFPGKLKNILQNGIEKTKKHTNNFLNFLLAYSGEDDIIEGVKKTIRQCLKENKELTVNKETIQNSLLSRDLPPVDLIIRTGVEKDPHNSAGFLMWQTQNSQLFFSDKCLPDFTIDDFEKAITDYCQRERRLGK